MMGPIPPSTNARAGGAIARRAGVTGPALALFALASLLLPIPTASAREAETDTTAAVPCAIIAEVGGQVDVLDSTRTHLLDSAEKAQIPCGAWVSVGKGSVELKHRDGFRIHAGAGTFVQLPEPNTDGHFSGDQAILYRGQVFAQAGGGSKQLRVLTANARARIQRGSAMVIYSQDEEETQVIALDHSSTLENRFQSSRRVEAKAGEATSLNFKQLRVVPSTPRAVAIAALRPKFDDLRVPERDRIAALRTARARQDRIFATELVRDENPDRAPAAAHTSAGNDDVGAQVRAHLEEAKAKQAKLAPHPRNYSSRPSDEQVHAIRKSWTSRLVAGQSGEEGLIAPAPVHRGPASTGHTAAGATQPAVKRKARHLTAEDEEKLRLIEELSRIREE